MLIAILHGLLLRGAELVELRRKLLGGKWLIGEDLLLVCLIVSLVVVVLGLIRLHERWLDAERQGANYRRKLEVLNASLRRSEYLAEAMRESREVRTLSRDALRTVPLKLSFHMLQSVRVTVWDDELLIYEGESNSFSAKRGKLRYEVAEGSIRVVMEFEHDPEPKSEFAAHMLLAALCDNIILTQNGLKDPLTGLLNRAEHLRRLSAEIDRALRQKEDLTVAFIDMDGLKWINDNFGHHWGDWAIKCVADTLRENVLIHQRQSDILSRWGGDEFVIILPSTGIEGSLVVLERLLEAVRTLCASGTPELQVTLSVGAIALSQLKHQDLSIPEITELLMRFADDAMYHSKMSGRDQLTVWSLDIPSKQAAQ